MHLVRQASQRTHARYVFSSIQKYPAKRPGISCHCRAASASSTAEAAAAASNGSVSVTPFAGGPDGCVIVSLNAPPVNSLSLSVLKDVTAAFRSLAAAQQRGDAAPHARAVRGVVLTSSERVFCAGLDINEMYAPDPERLLSFWWELQEAFVTLSAAPVPVVAALNGAAPAGGCLLAMTADRRLMAEGPHSIGLNETQLGIVAPWWFAERLLSLVGERHGERMLAQGLLLPPRQAEAVGLVDAVVPPDALLQSAADELEEMLRLPAAARHASKMLVRNKLLHRMTHDARRQDCADTAAFISSAETQANLRSYLEALKRRAKK